MTSIPSNAAGATPTRAPGAPGQQATVGAMPVATLDPVKLVRRHKWLLIGSVVAGAMLGLITHFVWMYVYPIYRSYVIFECYSPKSEVGISAPMAGQEEELDRFMQTQIKFMTSDLVLRKVVEDPNIEREAPKWCKIYYKDGRFRQDKALRDLMEDVKARVVPRTKLIELSMGFTSREDVAGVVRLVRTHYLEVLTQQGNRATKEEKDALAKSIEDTTREIAQQTTTRERLVRESNIETIDQRVSELRSQLQLYNEQLVSVRMDQAALNVRVVRAEEQLQNNVAIVYPDRMREDVENEPQMSSLRAQVSNAESYLQELARRYRPEHREYKAAEGALESAKQILESKREEMLRARFNAELDGARTQMAQLQAQEADLAGKAADLQAKLVDTTRVQQQIQDISTGIDRAIASRGEMSDKLKTLEAVIGLETSKRVLVYQSERVPERVTFPQLKILVPAGTVLLPALIGAFLIARELVDQRIKGPSDVTLIPRTRVVGMVPDASEDPAGAGAVETAFRDRTRGAIAESYRQLRAVVIKRMQQTGHRSLMVVAGMPGSGATSTACNLAMAMAATDQKVLLIDANFRRPTVHRVFGLTESPGVADVLTGKAQVAGSAQPTSVPGLSVLSVGSREHRQFERLGTDAMRKLLDDAKAQYDMVILDVAPAIVAGDGLALANRVDATLLVVRALAEKRGMVARIKNDLTETRAEFLGVLVNAVKSSAGGYLKGNIKATHEYHTENQAA
jgi:capsular exopolysaccharide synthesis family protein